jgi:hypothetical protein
MHSVTLQEGCRGTWVPQPEREVSSHNSFSNSSGGVQGNLGSPAGARGVLAQFFFPNAAAGRMRGVPE